MMNVQKMDHDDVSYIIFLKNFNNKTVVEGVRMNHHVTYIFMFDSL